MSDDVLANFKILLIGDSSCGKSSLLMRFTEGSFDEDMGPTIGVDFKSKDLNLNDNKVKLTLWDTAGQERFRTLTSSYYRGAQGVICVYDVSRRDTFDHIAMWLNEVDVYCTKNNVIKMLVANKIDLDREVTSDEGKKFAREHNMMYIDCSAKTKVGVQQAFEELGQKILDTPELWQDKGNGGMKVDGSSGAGDALADPCSACVI
eukprot:TRINITY_DN9363_c0_g1_i4.p1 TRINITY_DN9363_c0_g1~~TRINITY_DN9363_c0_g1_i4.p1  ORF type:complete len:205 (+),score=63.30 TRINITY_DN9363_c0_g1_i4:55-669(+)